MTESDTTSADDFDPGPPVARESPRHGFQGDRGASKAPPALPAGLTVAISREAGSRGGSIAPPAGERPGWQGYPQKPPGYNPPEGTLWPQPLGNHTPAPTARG